MSMTAAQLRVAALLMEYDDENDVSCFWCDELKDTLGWLLNGAALLLPQPLSVAVPVDPKSP